MDGALILDKPSGMTSHDAVVAARRLLGERRIGHLGTLDPFATGVLVLLVGRATRLARFYRARPKTYQGIIRFGYATDTMDRTGAALSEDSSPVVNEEELRRNCAELQGPYLQHPPSFSAKKVAGVPAHRLARRGQNVDLAPSPVVIHSLELRWVEGSRARFEANVSSGTYLRSLVNDLGERMEVGAHLTELRRTALGEFSEQDALTLEQLASKLGRGDEILIPMEELLPELPKAILAEAAAWCAGHGSDLELNFLDAAQVRMMNPQGRLIAIAERIVGNRYHPFVVLVTENVGGEAAAPEGPEAARSAGVC